MTIFYSFLLLWIFPLFWFFYRQHRICDSRQQETALVENNCGDRLSGLPRDILRHILSFLPTDAAVKTSLLSTQWRRLWTSVPVLLLDSRRFRASSTDRFVRFVEEVIRRRRRFRASSTDRFVRFVEEVIRRRIGDRIDVFRLTWHDGFDESKAEDWLSHAFRHSVREIKLDVRPGEQCRLPMHIFRKCPSLEVCRLDLPTKIWYGQPRPHITTFIETNVCLPSSANLAKLRVLHIRYFADTDKLLGKLISACPALEDLTVQVSGDIEISAPNLRALTLFCTWMSNASTARVFAPRLTSLTCYMHGAPTILLDGLCCPVHVNLTVSQEIENKNNVVGLLRSLRLVETLTLDDEFIEALSTVQDLSMQSEFNNLKYLWVKAPLDPHNAKTVFMLLEGCPNLETLVIDNAKVSKRASLLATIFRLRAFFAAKARHEDDWTCLTQKYSCSASKLKRITVNYFLGEDDELEFMNSLFSNASCLQEVHTNYRNISSYEADHVRVTAMLYSMIRASSTAEIFTDYF